MTSPLLPPPQARVGKDRWKSTSSGMLMSPKSDYEIIARTGEGGGGMHGLPRLVKKLGGIYKLYETIQYLTPGTGM